MLPVYSKNIEYNGWNNIYGHIENNNLYNIDELIIDIPTLEKCTHIEYMEQPYLKLTGNNEYGIIEINGFIL